MIATDGVLPDAGGDAAPVRDVVQADVASGAVEAVWLFVGTLGPAKPTFIVTGLFYPKADRQTQLFTVLEPLA